MCTVTPPLPPPPPPRLSLLPREIKVILNSSSARLALEKWYQFLGDKKKV